MAMIEKKDPMKVRHVRMSESEWAKAKQLGGSKWIREQINKAKLKENK
jgi:hypothetical protein